MYGTKLNPAAWWKRVSGVQHIKRTKGNEISKGKRVDLNRIQEIMDCTTKLWINLIVTQCIETFNYFCEKERLG